MPFAQPGRPFTRSDVESLRPDLIGVYGLFRADAWVYIGCGNIKARLLAHLDGEDARIARERPTHWTLEITSLDAARARTLIAELAPICT
jgi:hypothetical protein